MKRIQRVVLGLAILALTVGCDQAAKAAARNQLASGPPISILNGTVMLTYTRNPGALLSLGSQLSAELRFLIFIVFTALVLALMFVFAVQTRQISLVQLTGIFLIIGGGLGNLVDRIRYHGSVADFILLKLGIFQTGVFNLADVAIFLGVAIIMISFLPQRQESKPA